MSQTSRQRHIPRWILTTMTSLSSINKAMTRTNCLLCRLVSNSSRMEIIHSRETSERSRRAHLMWCTQVLERIMPSLFTWWTSSLLVMLDRSRRLLASSKWWTRGRKPWRKCNSNTAPFRTRKRWRNNSTPLWAQITPCTCKSNLQITVASTVNSSTLQVELHIKISNTCYSKFNYKTCTSNNNSTLKDSCCKTPAEQLQCNKPITTTRGYNTSLSR